MLAALLIAAGALWTVEPDQALVSIEVSGVSAVSHQLRGTAKETENGIQLELAAASFDKLVKDGQLGFEGLAQPQGRDGAMRLNGTLSLHGTRKPLALPITLVRVGHHAFAHAVLTLHLRDFGYVLPEGASDLARIEIDAGLKPDSVFASRG
jgi:hypothetical protein